MGDTDRDFVVGIHDFLTVLTFWGPCSGTCPDVDGDNNVGVVDFLAVLSHWGPCP